MNTFWSKAHHDLDDIAEKPPMILSVPTVASFVLLLMVLSLFVLSRKGTIVNLRAPAVNQELIALEELQKVIVEKGKSYPMFKEARIEKHAVSFSLNSDDFFDVGQAEVKSAAKDELLKVLKGLREIKSQFTIVVEYHTDGSPVVRHKWKYPTNWELSAFRAAAVVHLFEQSGFPPDRLAVAGFGSQRAKAQERTPAGEEVEANKALNRRVTIRVYPDQDLTGKD